MKFRELAYKLFIRELHGVTHPRREVEREMVQICGGVYNREREDLVYV